MGKRGRLDSDSARQISRRDAIRYATVAGPALVGAASWMQSASAGERAGPAATGGRLNQSIVRQDASEELALARRLAAMRSEDLGDLRRRYGEIVEERNQLGALLEEVMAVIAGGGGRAAP